MTEELPNAAEFKQSELPSDGVASPVDNIRRDILDVEKLLSDRSWLSKAKSILGSNSASMATAQQHFPDAFVRLAFMSTSEEFPQMLAQLPQSFQAPVHVIAQQIRKMFPSIATSPLLGGLAIAMARKASSGQEPSQSGVVLDFDPEAVSDGAIISRVRSTGLAIVTAQGILPAMRVVFYDHRGDIIFSKTVNLASVIFTASTLLEHVARELNKLNATCKNVNIVLDQQIANRVMEGYFAARALFDKAIEDAKFVHVEADDLNANMVAATVAEGATTTAESPEGSQKNEP